MKVEVDKVGINESVNVPTSLNNVKVDYFDIGKLKTFPVDFKKIIDVVDNEVVKKAKSSTLKTRVNKLDKKISDTTTLIHISQCNTDYQSLEKKIGDDEKNIPDTSGLVTTTVLDRKKIEKLIKNT